ncbi:MAG: DUF1643 domain-containing protein [Ruminococcaceae bacterium]|nr:DUF1643 domain-containing protein [Oscillospiraceae bacterium]
MHIPLCETNEMEILSFEDALRSEADGSFEYNREKWLYVPNAYTEYRYILGTRGVNPLVCIGINPSTAKPDDLDNTLKSVERTAKFNGYDSFIMFNVYAQRATNPKDMDGSFNEYLHRENMNAFRYIMSSYEKGRKPAIWAAWGTIIEKRPYLIPCVKDMIEIGNEYDAQWFSVGKKSVKGHPHHPLYLKNNSPTEEFDVVGYVKKLSLPDGK